MEAIWYGKRASMASLRGAAITLNAGLRQNSNSFFILPEIKMKNAAIPIELNNIRCKIHLFGPYAMHKYF